MTAKILYYDIETAPNMSYVWGHYDQNVIAHEREWYILCVSWRWEHENKTHCAALTDWPGAYKSDPENDYHVVRTLHELLNEADIIVAHNGDKFDKRKANTRFIHHGLGPTSPVLAIDTLKVARKYFYFNSNKLDDLGQFLGIGRKVSTGGWETWAGCMRGEAAAWKRMIRYAKRDVVLLRKVYMAMRAWDESHPNLNMYDELDGCPTCRAPRSALQKRGPKRTKTMAYQLYYCTKCGAWPKSRMSIKNHKRPEIVR